MNSCTWRYKSGRIQHSSSRRASSGRMVSNRNSLSLFLVCLAVLSAAAAISVQSKEILADDLLQLRHSRVSHKVDLAISRLTESGRFNTLISLLKSTSLTSALESLDKLTLFAPNDKAFASVNATRLISRLSQEQVIQLLKFHALPKYYNPLNFLDRSDWIRTVASGNSFKYELTVEESSYYNISIETGVNNAVASWIFDQYPVVVYEVDAVLIPKELRLPGSSAAPAPAPAASETVVPATAPLAALAPAPAPESLPESPVSAPAAAAAAEAIRALEEMGEFKTLISVLQSEKLIVPIESLGAFTLFAPTDAAFNQLPAGALDKLSTAEAIDLLEFHLVLGYHSLASLMSQKDPVATLASSGRPGRFELKFLDENKALTIETGVDQVQVVSNVFDREPQVVVYSVDKVLLPPEVFGSNTAPQVPAAAPPQVPSAPVMPSPEAGGPLPSPALAPVAQTGLPPRSAANSVLAASLWTSLLVLGLIRLAFL